MKSSINIILKYRLFLIIAAAAALIFTFTDVSQSKILKDQLGRVVTISGKPERIVALAPSITEIIFALGKGSLIKGATQYSNFPERAKKIPRIGSYVHLDIEKIVALRPDLCVAVKDGNPQFVIKKLEALKIPVYAVDPRNIESVIETLKELGVLLDASKKSKAVIQNMQERIDKIKKIVAKADHIPKIFFQIGISPIVSVGTNTFVHELICLAGGTNLARGNISYPRYSKEQVLAFSPEIFIITSMARGGLFEKVKLEWSRWSDLPAVKNDRILLVDSNIFDRATPRLIDALEVLAKLIHPELFTTEIKRSQK